MLFKVVGEWIYWFGVLVWLDYDVDVEEVLMFGVVLLFVDWM